MLKKFSHWIFSIFTPQREIEVVREEVEKYSSSRRESIFVIPQGVLDILDYVEEKIDEVGGIKEVSSEGRRSMVYGSLIKHRPLVSKKHISLAIEIIINRRR